MKAHCPKCSFLLLWDNLHDEIVCLACGLRYWKGMQKIEAPKEKFFRRPMSQKVYLD